MIKLFGKKKIETLGDKEPLMCPCCNSPAKITHDRVSHNIKCSNRCGYDPYISMDIYLHGWILCFNSDFPTFIEEQLIHVWNEKIRRIKHD